MQQKICNHTRCGPGAAFYVDSVTEQVKPVSIAVSHNHRIHVAPSTNQEEYVWELLGVTRFCVSHLKIAHSYKKCAREAVQSLILTCNDLALVITIKD